MCRIPSTPAVGSGRVVYPTPPSRRYCVSGGASTPATPLCTSSGRERRKHGPTEEILQPPLTYTSCARLTGHASSQPTETAALPNRIAQARVETALAVVVLCSGALVAIVMLALRVGL
jgi:hypothetical protein